MHVEAIICHSGLEDVQNLALRLDAASLDNLKPGDVVVPRRLVQVNGKVLATVDWEARHEP